MRGRTTQIQLTVDEATYQQLHQWLRAQKTPLALAKRAQAILLLAAGQKLTAIEQQVGLAERHIRKWAQRFAAEGLAGLQDRPRPGRPPTFSPGGCGASGQARL